MLARDHWQEAEDLFFQALDIAPSAREAFLYERSGDQNIVSEVLSLLAAHDEESLLDASLMSGGFGDTLANALAPPLPERIGRYQILGEIGSGGMATVYLGERAEGDFAQRVAVKVIRFGCVSQALLGRFLAERRILAALSHPNIARLYDGGATDRGLLYIAMEYVRGVSITEYCNARNLTISERLRLFADVCRAVDYAHRNLVVHRDLKPSNILVNEEGAVKLLDFGIAKLLADDDRRTQTHPDERLLTPAYASPEQIRGDATTTAVDIYALGVALYELLTGRMPYEFTAYDQALAVIENAMPFRPSVAIFQGDDEVPACGGLPLAKLKKRLAGDVDVIVLRAMHKEPERRYPSAESLAEDIERHLVGLPIKARPEKFWYLTSKFIRRHRWQTVATALIAASLIGGSVATALQYRTAQKRAVIIRETSNDFIFKIHDEVAKLSGSTKAREMLIENGLANLDKLAQENAGDAESLRELAAAYRKFGDLQGRVGFGNRGNLEKALTSYWKVHELLFRAIQNDPGDASAMLDLAETNLRMATILERSGRLREAKDRLVCARELLEKSAILAPSDERLRVVIRSSKVREKSFNFQAQEFIQMAKLAQQIFSEDEAHFLNVPANDLSRQELVIDNMMIGNSYQHIFELLDLQVAPSRLFSDYYAQQSLQAYQNALQILDELIQIHGETEELTQLRAIAGLDALGLKCRFGHADAWKSYSEQVAILKKSHLADRANAESAYEWLYFERNRGVLEMQRGNVAAGVQILDGVCDEYRILIATSPNNQEFQADLCKALFFLGEGYSSLGSGKAAALCYLDCLRLSAKIIAADPITASPYGAYFIPSLCRLESLSAVEKFQKTEISNLTKDVFDQLSFVAGDPNATVGSLLTLAQLMLTSSDVRIGDIENGLGLVRRIDMRVAGREPLVKMTLCLAHCLHGDLRAKDFQLEAIFQGLPDEAQSRLRTHCLLTEQELKRRASTSMNLLQRKENLYGNRNKH